MNRIIIACGATLLAATLLAPAPAAAFNLQINGAPPRVAHAVRCCGEAAGQVHAGARYQDDDSWEEHEDRLEAVADNESDYADEESCDEGEQPTRLKKPVTASRGKLAPSVRSSVSRAKGKAGTIKTGGARSIEAKAKRKAVETKTVAVRTVESKTAEPEKSQKIEKPESAPSSEKREVAAALEGNGECKRFVPAAGMTVSVHCE